MSQQNFSNGQTSLTPQDFLDRLGMENTEYLKSGVDALTPLEIALPAYATSYTGSYYRTPSNTSAPTAFSTAWRDLATGKIYEETIPNDCRDDGIECLSVYFGTDGYVNQSNVVETADENDWDLASVSTIYWRNHGRKFRAFVPVLYSASANLKYSEDYKRLPTYPSAVGDAIDAPAEDIATLYSLWKEQMLAP